MSNDKTATIQPAKANPRQGQPQLPLSLSRNFAKSKLQNNCIRYCTYSLSNLFLFIHYIPCKEIHYFHIQGISCFTTIYKMVLIWINHHIYDFVQ